MIRKTRKQNTKKRQTKKRIVKVVRKRNQNQQPQKQNRRRRKGPGRKKQTNNTQYGGPFNMKKGTSRDYRCVIAEETIAIQPSNDSANFGVLNTYNINPGSAATFPLLSQEAAVFETYKFEYLEFYTVPSVSGYAAGGQTGSVSISVDFNASHAQPISYTAAVDLDPADEDLPCNDLKIVLPPEKMHQQNLAKFIRTGGLPGSSDIKTYDVGNLFVCAEGLSATQFNVNRLYCRYKCHLYTRVDVAGAGAPQNNSVTNLVDSQAALTTLTPYQPLLASTASTARPVINGIGVVNTAGSIVPPAGNYFLSVSTSFNSTSQVLSTCILNVLKNAVVQNPMTNTNTYEFNNTGALTGDVTLAGSIFVTCNGTDAITLSIEAVFGAGTCNATTNFVLVAI